MPGVLISGPAGGGKSGVAHELLLEAGAEPTVLADFQEIYVAVSGVERGPDGRYPLRRPELLPVVQYLKNAAISTAVRNRLRVLVTNSDGSDEVRLRILSHLYAGRIPRDSELVEIVNESRFRPLAEVLRERYPDVAEPFQISEIVVDPGEGTVRDRLSDPRSGELSVDCSQAIGRWYARRGRVESWTDIRRR